MENPATWGKLERTIGDAIQEAEQARANQVIGLSMVRRIADKLRAEGLVLHDPEQREQLASGCNCRGPGKGCLRGHEDEGCECLAGNCTC